MSEEVTTLIEEGNTYSNDTITATIRGNQVIINGLGNSGNEYGNYNVNTIGKWIDGRDIKRYVSTYGKELGAHVLFSNTGWNDLEIDHPIFPVDVEGYEVPSNIDTMLKVYLLGFEDDDTALPFIVPCSVRNSFNEYEEYNQRKFEVVPQCTIDAKGIIIEYVELAEEVNEDDI